MSDKSPAVTKSAQETPVQKRAYAAPTLARMGAISVTQGANNLQQMADSNSNSNL